jgi:biopolymer transport protein ExbD
MRAPTFRPEDDLGSEYLLPMLGITFLIALFFLTNIAFSRPLRVEFGPVPERDPASIKPIAHSIRISGAGALFFDGAAVDAAGLRSALAELRINASRKPVAIIAEDGSSSTVLFQVVELCKQIGLRNVQLSTGAAQ